jgi:succinyl-CoA synthetase beta subunit
MKNMTEKEAEDFLEKKGFDVVQRVLINSVEELKKTEKSIAFPWVMKISSTNITHKAKIGGTVLGVNSYEVAVKNFYKLSKIEGCEGVLIQPMILGQELIIGIKKTPEFSEVIMFGKGGSNVESENDVSFRVVPLSKEDAEEMIKETKIYGAIKEKINEKQIIKNLLSISELAEKNPSIKELDINPLIANKKQAIVVDARLQFE